MFFAAIDIKRVLSAGIRFLCAAIFATSVLPVFAAAEDEAQGYKVWISGSLPGDCISEGVWHWDDKVLCNGAMSHTQYSANGIDRHSFKAKEPIAVNTGSSVIQYVYIDPQSVPDGIMLKIFLIPGEDMSFYWEGYEEAFVALDEYISAWYMDFMPRAGEWIRLAIDFGQLDLPNAAEISGIEYIVSNGRVWWGQTLVSA